MKSLLIAAVLFSISINSYAIMFGEKVSENNFKGVGALTQFGSLLCTGTFITKRHFLTATHCAKMLVEDKIDEAKIYLGEGQSQGQMDGQYSIEAIYTHPLFEEKRSIKDLHHHDIAIFKIAEEADVEPIKLLPSDLLKESLDGLEVTMVGYGLRETAYDYMRRNKGKKYLTKNIIDTVGESEFKISEEISGRPCNMDSGGPAFVSIDGFDYQIGVVSRGDIWCSKTSIYGIVSDQNQWILEQLEK